MQGFGLVVRFNLRPGHEAQFDALVSETLNGIRNQEPGTLVYATHTLTEAPGTRVFYELYRDRDMAEWPRDPDGTIAMVTLPLDLAALLAEAR